MIKKLSDMSLEELWRLFPITLTDYKTYWTDWYNEEAGSLSELLPPCTRFYHIGSTAISGIAAKPIVDILLVINSDEELKQSVEILQEHGYIVMSSSATRVSLNKGYTETGFAEKVFHLHVRFKDDIDEIYFRDYLNSHPDVAKEYEKLKFSLCKKYRYDRDAYTDAKRDFVKIYTDIAKSAFLHKKSN